MISSDKILSQFGLETKKTARDFILPAIGLVGVGAAVGAGVALLMAPKSGNDMRADIRNGAMAGANRLAEGAGKVASSAGRFARKLPFVPDASSNGALELDDMTREDLYARAQELEIAGRSDMTKEELFEAVRAS